MTTWTATLWTATLWTASLRSPQPWVPPSEFERIYGPQLSWTPAEARDLLEGLPVPWWVAGGWAIEAFTGVAREHEDIDLSILRETCQRCATTSRAVGTCGRGPTAA